MRIDGACFFNPSVIHYEGNLYFWVMRMWRIPGSPGCADPAASPDGAWASAWVSPRSTQALVTALLEHSPETGEPLRVVHMQVHSEAPTGVIFPKGLESYQRMPDAAAAEWREDARAFRDEAGQLRLLHASHASPGRGWHSQEPHTTLVTINATLTDAGQRYNVALAPHSVLQFTPAEGAPKKEKNFVPWSGTALMTYSHFPHGFWHHSVFDWGTYAQPKRQERFASDAVVPFFQHLRRFAVGRGHHQFHVGGGSPAVRYGNGWLAVGHIEESMACFHNSIYGQQRAGFASDAGDDGADVQQGAGGHRLAGSRCVPRLLRSLRCGKGGIRRGGGGSGRPQPRRRLAGTTAANFTIAGHHLRDYFAFLYMFKATPPYLITHVSAAFKPLSPSSGRPHRGVIFPCGIERFKDGVMVSYGEDDMRTLLLVLSKGQVDEMLTPIEGHAAAAAVESFQYCAIETQEKAMG